MYSLCRSERERIVWVERMKVVQCSGNATCKGNSGAEWKWKVRGSECVIYNKKFSVDPETSGKYWRLSLCLLASDMNRFAFYIASPACGIGKPRDGRWMRRPVVLQDLTEAGDPSLQCMLSSVPSGMKSIGQNWALLKDIEWTELGDCLAGLGVRSQSCQKCSSDSWFG